MINSKEKEFALERIEFNLEFGGGENFLELNLIIVSNFALLISNFQIDPRLNSPPF